MERVPLVLDLKVTQFFMLRAHAALCFLLMLLACYFIVVRNAVLI